jgi:hypothetical protein
MNFNDGFHCHFIGIRMWECCLAYLISIIMGTRNGILRFGLVLRKRMAVGGVCEFCGRAAFPYL